MGRIHPQSVPVGSMEEASTLKYVAKKPGFRSCGMVPDGGTDRSAGEEKYSHNRGGHSHWPLAVANTGLGNRGSKPGNHIPLVKTLMIDRNLTY